MSSSWQCPWRPVKPGAGPFGTRVWDSATRARRTQTGPHAHSRPPLTLIQILKPTTSAWRICSPEKAIEHFKRSLELDANRASTYYWLGSLYFHRDHDYRVAVQYLEQAVDRAPELEAAHQMLIQAYKRLGEDAKAAAQLRRYEEIVQQRAKVETPE